jgi:putative glycosyltransferase
MIDTGQLRDHIQIGQNGSGLATSLVQATPYISIVSTMYRSRPFLERFLAECLQALFVLNCTEFEIVLVNDGSPDDSLDYAVSRRKDIPQLVIIDLSRNFGHHYAMQAGLRHTRGNLVFLIDCDLEVSPLTLPEFKAKLDATGSDMVYGYQESRKGGLFEKASGGFFYKAFNLLSDIKIPENIATERIMTRRYVEALLQLGDRNLFLGGMMSWTGFQQLGLPLQKKQREGRSSYTLLARIHLMVNAVSSFSAQPLVWMFNIGLTITTFSFLYVFYLVARKVLFDDALLGFTSMVALTTLSLGIMTTGMGVIGIYLGKVFTQVQNRPTYIVKDIYKNSTSISTGGK